MSRQHHMNTRIPAALILMGLLGLSACETTPSDRQAEAQRAAGGDAAAAQKVKTDLRNEVNTRRGY